MQILLFLDHQISDLNEDPILSIIELEHSKVSSLVLDLSKTIQKMIVKMSIRQIRMRYKSIFNQILKQ